MRIEEDPHIILNTEETNAELTVDAEAVSLGAEDAPVRMRAAEEPPVYFDMRSAGGG